MFFSLVSDWLLFVAALFLPLFWLHGEGVWDDLLDDGIKRGVAKSPR
jgi:hypothetical protein